MTPTRAWINGLGTSGEGTAHVSQTPEVDDGIRTPDDFVIQLRGPNSDLLPALMRVLTTDDKDLTAAWSRALHTPWARPGPGCPGHRPGRRRVCTGPAVRARRHARPPAACPGDRRPPYRLGHLGHLGHVNARARLRLDEPVSRVQEVLARLHPGLRPRSRWGEPVATRRVTVPGAGVGRSYSEGPHSDCEGPQTCVSAGKKVSARLADGGAGGTRTHGRRIMSPLL